MEIKPCEINADGICKRHCVHHDNPNLLPLFLEASEKGEAVRLAYDKVHAKEIEAFKTNPTPVKKKCNTCQRRKELNARKPLSVPSMTHLQGGCKSCGQANKMKS